MGARNIDRWSASDWREHFPTVILMRKARWQVWAKCEGCGARHEVSLAEVELERGGDFTLWGRRPRCHTMLCKARVRLMALPPHARAPFCLSDQPRLSPPATPVTLST